MKVRIYKATGRFENAEDAWTILFKLPKCMLGNEHLSHAMFCGKPIEDRMYGYWDELPKTARLGIDYFLGKRIPIEDAPQVVREFAEHKEKIWNKACNTGNWEEWNND